MIHSDDVLGDVMAEVVVSDVDVLAISCLAGMVSHVDGSVIIYVMCGGCKFVC